MIPVKLSEPLAWIKVAWDYFSLLVLETEDVSRKTNKDFFC